VTFKIVINANLPKIREGFSTTIEKEVDMPNLRDKILKLVGRKIVVIDNDDESTYCIRKSSESGLGNAYIKIVEVGDDYFDTELVSSNEYNGNGSTYAISAVTTIIGKVEDYDKI